MNDKNFTVSKSFILVVFILLIAYFLKLTLIDSDGIITSSYNRRMSNTKDEIKKGTIYDRNGRILAESVASENGYTRNYAYPQALFHLLGYNGEAGISGVEAIYNFHMQELQNEISQRLGRLNTDSELVGSDITLTIDAELSQFIYDKIKLCKAAVVIIEPSTGKIIAMVSSPAPDANTLDADLLALKDDNSKPLINRATNGLYEPASTFKIVTAAAALKHDKALADFSYTCNGKTLADGTPLSCSNSHAHGEVNMQKAFALSCNAYFATLAREYLCVGEIDELLAASEDFFYNAELGYMLDYKNSIYESIQLAEPGTRTADIMQTSIGQGKTRASVLHQAMIAAAIANGGLMMKPYVQNDLTPEALGLVTTLEIADIIKTYMRSCVLEGTGKATDLQGIEISGKTGTGQKGTEKDNSWFVGFSGFDHPEFAISILVEDGNSGIATEIASEIFNFIY